MHNQENFMKVTCLSSHGGGGGGFVRPACTNRRFDGSEGINRLLVADLDKSLNVENKSKSNT